MRQETTKPLMSKAALLARIQNAYEPVHRILEAGDDQALLEAVGSGGWTLKDSLAHLAAWEMILLEFHLGEEILCSRDRLRGGRLPGDIL